MESERFPPVGKDRLQMTRGIDDQGAEVMIERTAITFEVHIRGSRKFADLIRAA